jgi:hypothetical protein
MVPYTQGFKGHNQIVISVIKYLPVTGTAWFAVDSILGQGTLDMNTAQELRFKDCVGRSESSTSCMKPPLHVINPHKPRHKHSTKHINIIRLGNF